MRRAQRRQARVPLRTRLQALGAAGSVLSPLLAWPAFLLVTTPGAARARGWEVLWIGYFALLALPALFAEGALGLLWVTLQCGVGYATCRFFTAPLALVRSALLAAVAVIAVAVEVEATIFDRTWTAPGQHPREQIEGSNLWGVDRVGGPAAYRQWELPAASGELRLSFESKWLEGAPGWSWRPSPDVDVTQGRGPDRRAARLDMPPQGEAWAARDYEVGSAIAGARVALELRSTRAGTGNLHILVDGEPVHVEPVEVRDDWRRVVAMWRPEQTARPDVVTVKLSEFAGHTLFARNVTVEAAAGLGPGATGEGGSWRSLGHPRQAHPRLAIGTADGGDVLDVEPASILPTSGWRPVTAQFEHEQLATVDAVRTMLQLEPGTSVAVRNVKLADAASGAPARARGTSARTQLWHGHPNLLGHGVAVAGLIMAATLPKPAVALAGVAVAAAAAAYTGGRASLLVLLVGALALGWFRVRGRPALRASIALLLVLVACAGIAYVLVAGEAREEAGQAPRAAIAAVAVEALRGAPWTGIGPSHDAFAEVWQEQGVPFDPVVHAHNWWLHHGVVYGWIGIVAAFWFTLALLRIGWRAGHWRGAVLVTAVVALQIFDVTLLHWAVLSPLALALNALARRDAAGARTGAAGPPPRVARR